MSKGFLKSSINGVWELEKLMSENKGVILYGAGEVCEKILAYLENEDKIDYVKKIIVTHLTGIVNKRHGIEINEYCADRYDNRYPIIITPISCDIQNEIVDFLVKDEVKTVYLIQKDFEKNIDNLLQDIKYSKSIKKIQKYVKNLNCNKIVEDVRFFSFPYWDAYSPFSAVPCLVAQLRQNGYKAGQVDLGILCTHWMINNKWKDAADLCTSQKFYKNNIENYRKNLYISYEEFIDDMWFFKKDRFDVGLVKEKYLEMNYVQKRVLDAFYRNIYSLDASRFDFEQCRDLERDVEHYIQSNFLEEITSNEIISIFENLPEILGFSITSIEQFLPACLLAKIVKDIWPEKIIIMGGSCADLFIKCQYKKKTDIYKFFDYIIVGEGETSISLLMDFLVKGWGNYDEIPNLLHIDEGEQPFFAEQIIENVNMLFIPDYDGLDLDLYLSPEKILPYQSSRGCHYGYCAFCNHDEKYRHHYRTKNMKNVVEELVYLSQKYDVNNFQFVDEAIRPDCFRQMVEEMDKKEEFKEINWFFYSRVSRQYDKELLERAYKNGCRMVMFGVESFNQRLLNFIKKGIYAETSKYCLELFHNCKIKTYAWLMCNLPSETVQEAREDLANVHEMEKFIDAFSVGPFFLSRNTDMYANPEKYNITYIDETNQYRFMSHNNGEEINKDDMLKFYFQEYEKYQLEFFSTGNRYTLFWEDL